MCLKHHRERNAKYQYERKRKKRGDHYTPHPRKRKYQYDDGQPIVPRRRRQKTAADILPSVLDEVQHVVVIDSTTNRARVFVAAVQNVRIIVPSDPAKFADFVLTAQERGYRVALDFVTVPSPDTQPVEELDA